MHIITKFLVILASVLAVLLAGLTVAYTANADRIVDELQQARNTATAEKTRADSVERRVAANTDSLMQEKQAFETAAQRAENNLKSLQTELNEARTETQRLALSEQRYQNQIDQFIALSDQDKALREAQQQELRSIRDQVNAQARQIIELVDRNSDLVSELESSKNLARALEEQLIVARRGGSTGSAASASLPDSFRARVTSVIEDADGSVLVEINAGSSDRLAEGMELIAVRDGRFLAKISLMRVDLNEAVGRVVLTGAGDIQTDDQVQPPA